MLIQDTLSLASQALSSENVPHALIGGFALAAHGIVRATVDIDLLVHGDKARVAETSLLKAGFLLVHKSPEVLQFSGLGQLDILLANRPPSQAMLARAKQINGFPIPVIIAEDLVGLKIQAYKNDSNREFQDKADIQSIIQNLDNLDFSLIKAHADLFDEWHFIESLRKK